ncbi:hypothetical protein BV20DRAFT_589100 [Pilatotrama ljubarskyi]|nr:hypothetical protein BV20DRAFT_589100 [Pilatotrama ljubarskyi]
MELPQPSTGKCAGCKIIIWLSCYRGENLNLRIMELARGAMAHALAWNRQGKWGELFSWFWSGASLGIQTIEHKAPHSSRFLSIRVQFSSNSWPVQEGSTG